MKVSRIIENSESNEEKSTDQVRADLDTILEEIGQFGRYQARSVLLLIVYVIFGAFSGSEFVFTTARINTRCLIPECDVSNPEFAPTWILNAVPGDSQNSFEQCERYVSSNNSSYDPTCQDIMFDQQATEPCEDYVYENAETVVYDFNLACDEWTRNLIGSIRTVGTLFCLPITGFISDRWGRRAALAFNGFNTAWLGLLRYWTKTYWGFVTSQVLEATFGAGGFSCCYILVLELIGPKYRVAGGACMSTFFSIGQMLTGLIAWAVPDWRTLTLVLYSPMLILFSYFWIMSESVRWLMSKGLYAKSEEVLKNVARVNGKHLSETSLRALRNSDEQEKMQKQIDKLNMSKEPWLPIMVFRCKPVLIRCLVAPIWWISMTLTYYGLSLNAVNLSGNKYLNYVAVSAVEIPGFWMATFLINRVGRKRVLIGGYLICAICMIGYIFLPSGLFSLSLTLYFIGKCSISAVVTALYVYTAELFPTRHRHRLFAYSSMIGRLGSIAAPLTPALGALIWSELPFALFGAFCLVSGLLVCITPETLGQKMCDTMDEAAAMGVRNDQK